MEHEWKAFTRSIHGDLSKGLGKKLYPKAMTPQGGQRPSKTLRLETVTFEGVGCVTNVTLFKSSGRGNLRLFYQAADWFVDNQADNGGWPVGVVFNEKSIKYPMAAEVIMKFLFHTPSFLGN